MTKRKTTDAHEPNAGTDFHVLWSVQKCLELLNFKNDGLKAVAIESLTPVDALFVDPAGDGLLGVDLTEYFGGVDFKNASRVSISQLKYSTRHADKDWTPFSISQGKNSGTTGSIIHRLADSFKRLVDAHGMERVIRKTTIKLVSNCSASPLLQLLTVLAGQMLAATPNKTTLQLLKKKSKPTHVAAIDKLFAAAALDIKSFIYFLSILDFSDCGAGSREWQKQKAVKAIIEFGVFDAWGQYSKLAELVRAKAMPETKANNTIVKENILLLFDFPDLRSMFPVPSRFEQLYKVIERDQIPDIIKLIEKSIRIPICLHGVAGIGKSTIVQQLPVHLPAGSETIIFDCYGGGSYLDSDDKRHKHQNALMYICNELALKTGSSFLINRTGDKDFYISEFSRRLQQVSVLMTNRSKDALLVIIIDAADNSVSAIERRHEHSFVTDLMNISFPENVRLVVTSRSHRVDSLQLPDDYAGLKLLPFTFNETFQYLQAWFTNVTKKESDEFNRLSNGIPRVMSYTMEAAGDTLKEKLRPLKPRGKTLDDIFKKMLKDAEKKSGDPSRFKKLIRLLNLLPRPIPVQYLEKIADVSVHFVTDIVIDLSKGVTLENGIIGFRDEDFESFLHEQYLNEAIKYATIADFFLAEAETDEYASTYLGRFLISAKKYAELENIVIERKFIQLPIDILRNREVFIERARLAMQHPGAGGNTITFLKLQVIAAEASKANTVLEDLMIQKPELAAAFGNGESNRKIYFEKGKPQWFGRIHMKNAAILARNPATIEQAKEHLKNANDWILFRRRLPKDELEKYRIELEDIAFGAEAVFRMEGAINGVQWLLAWRPRTNIFFCIEPLVKNLIAFSTPTQLKNWCRTISFLRADVALQINQIFSDNGLTVPFDATMLVKAMRPLIRARNKIQPVLRAAIMSLAEDLLRKKISLSKIKPILHLLDFENPDSEPSLLSAKLTMNNNIEQTSNFFRSITLVAVLFNKDVVVEELLPYKLRIIDKELKYEQQERKENERNKCRTIYKHLLAVYALFANHYKRPKSVGKLRKELNAILTAFVDDVDFRYRYENEWIRMSNFLSVKLLDFCFTVRDPSVLVNIISDKLSSKRINNVEIKLSMAERLCFSVKTSELSLRLLEEADRNITKSVLPASTQIAHYSLAAITANNISHQAGRYYFDKLIEASKDIDMEAFDQIKCVNKIVAAAGSMENPRLAYDFARFTEFVASKMEGYDDFPWDPAVDAIGGIDPMSLLPVTCRWDHRNIRELKSNLPHMFIPALAQQKLDIMTVAGLLPLSFYYWDNFVDTFKVLIGLFKKNATTTQRNIFLKDILGDLTIKYSYGRLSEKANEILQAMDVIHFSNGAAYQDFKNYFTEVNQMIGRKTARDYPEVRTSKTKYPILFKTKNLRKVDVTSSSSMVAYCTKKKIMESGYQSLYETETGMDVIFKMVQPKDYVAHLNAYIELPGNFMNFFSFEAGLEKRLKAWEIYPNVKRWKKQNFEKIVRTHFSRYIILDENRGEGSLYKLAALCDINKEDLSSIMIKLIPDYVNDLNASSLYRLLEITGNHFSSAEKMEFLQWLVTRWTQPIPVFFGDGVYTTALAPLADTDINVARFLRYQLGHPDKRIRWRASKALVRLVIYGKHSIVAILLKEQNEEKCIPVQHNAYIFYWIAAKQWLWIALHKLCMTNPSIMLEFAKDFLKEIHSPLLQHTQILYFVKQGCLHLEKFAPGTFLADELKAIHACLTSQLAPAAKTKTVPISYRGKESYRFPFDYLDTMEYWFRPLGRLFDITEHDIAQLADSIICDTWGFTGNVNELDHVKTGDYQSMRHYKFDIPVIEDLRTYYEYNAMLCVAAELIKTRPLVEEKDYWSSWQEWLKDYGLVWDDCWFTDLKDPVPLEEVFWTDTNRSSDWQKSVSEEDLNKLVVSSEEQKQDFLIIASNITLQYGKDSEHHRVNSALVEPKYAEAAMRAMQTIERNNYVIPDEEELGSSPDDDEKAAAGFIQSRTEEKIIKDAFKLIPWIKSLGRQHRGVDQFAPDVIDLPENRYVIGSQFSDWAKLYFSKDKRFSARSQIFSNPVTILQTWTNAPERKQYNEDYSYGQRLFIRVDELKTFLREKDLVLLVNSEIVRYPETYDYNKGMPYHTRIYLIYPNGQIKTISGDIKLR